MDKYYSSFKYHMMICVIALIINMALIFVIFATFKDKTALPLTQLEIPAYDHIPNYAGGLSQQYAVQRTLETGDILIFGSSELSSHAEEVSYRFLKNKLNKNVLAFGAAGSQSITTLAQLSTYYNQTMLDNARVVIILSPSWFDTEGTHIESFLSTMPANMLMRLLYESQVPYEYKKYIQEYIHDNFDQLSSPKPIHLAWKYAFPRKEAAIQYRNRIYAELAKYTQYYPYQLYDTYLKSKLSTTGQPLPSTPTTNYSFNWEELFATAIQLQTSQVTNNPYGINDDYFNNYVRKRIKEGEFPIKAPLIATYSEEYRDFLVLVEFCKMFKHKPLFVLLPFNSKAYTGLENYQPVIDNISTTLTDAQMPLLNIWKDGDKPGMMADIMHTGALGWQKINQSIYQHFIEGK